MKKNEFKPLEVVVMWFDKLNFPGRKKPLKLYHRIVFFFIIAFTFVLTLSFIMVFFFSQQLIFKESQATIIQYNNYIINTIDDNRSLLLSLPENQRLDKISELIYPYSKNNLLLSYRLFDNTNHSYQSSSLFNDIIVPDTVNKNKLSLFNNTTKTTKNQLITVDSFRYNQTEYYYLGSTYIFDNDSLITIQIIKNIDDSYTFLTTLFILLISVSILSLLVIIFIGIYGTKSSLKPLIKISEATKNITENNLNIRIEETGNKDELDQLIISVNQMIMKLESAFDTQKRFVSDASHELRIPLTVIQGYTDILKDWGKNDPLLMDESITAIGDEIELMKHMVYDLLLITRIENNYFDDDFELLDLSTIIEKIYFECQMIDSAHHYSINVCNHTCILGNENLIIQAIRGILDNSSKYTPTNGTISLCCYSNDASSNIIMISDSGQGIPDGELEKIKQRFYRINDDRSRQTGGTGLGLSIIDSIVALHHGQLIITSDFNHGTCVSIILNKH